MNERKKITLKLALLVNTLEDTQSEASQHKKYLFRLFHNHQVLLLATLFPAFLWGWKIAQQKVWKTRMMQVIKTGALTSFSYFKRYYYHDFFNSTIR